MMACRAFSFVLRSPVRRRRDLPAFGRALLLVMAAFLLLTGGAVFGAADEGVGVPGAGVGGGVPGGSCPADKTVECGTAWTFDDPTAPAFCPDTNVTLTILGTVTNAQPCLFIATRTWMVSDNCGTAMMCVQNVTVTDTMAPVLNCATNKTVLCDSGWSFDPPTGNDGCFGTNLLITVLGTTTNGAVCPPTITRTWEVMDPCGNHDLCTQTVTAIDTSPPMLICAPNRTVPLGSTVDFDPPTAIDTCCGTNTTITILNTVTNSGPCGLSVTRTWEAADCCMNLSTCSQTLTFSQTAPPQISSIYVPCGGSKITIGFTDPPTAASAQNTANYAVDCGGQLIPITQAVLAGSRIVCLYLSQPVGIGCSIAVGNIQDACGNVMPMVFQMLPCTPGACVSGSAGTEYWLTFPGNDGPDPANQPKPQLFITGTAGTVGTVAIPGLAVPFTSNFVIPGSSGITVLLPLEADLGMANDVVQTNGVHVIASQPVTVHGFNSVQFSSDGYLGLSTTALGLAYRVLAYRNTLPDVPELAGSQFAVVGTVDGTTVTIVPPSDVGVHAAGVPFNVTLMRGETYQLSQTNWVADDLTGALVIADQPVAVFGSHRSAIVPNTNSFFSDHLVEQLIPTDSWGTNFVSVTLANRAGGDTFRFLGLLTNTVVRTNGIPLAAPLNQGQFVEILLAVNSHITADKPILVAQYANSSDFDGVEYSDCFMTLLPPTSFHGTSYSFHSPGQYPLNFVNLTVPVSGVGQLSLDGSPIPAGSFAVIGASGYAGARIAVGGGPHTLTSSGPAFGVIVYGWSQYEGYGYPAGLCSGSPAAPPGSFTCPPSSLSLQTGPNCTAVIPDLTALVGNAGAALLITQAPPAGTVVAPGSYNITVTITGQSGQRQVCVTALTVFQNGASGLLCPANITTNCATGAGRAVTFQPTVCDTNYSVSCVPVSGSVFPPGVTAVTCTVPGPMPADQCSFTVTVTCLTLTIAPTPFATASQTILWPGGGTLYKATNVVGPYLPMPGVGSPFTNTVRGQGFFRVGP